MKCESRWKIDANEKSKKKEKYVSKQKRKKVMILLQCERNNDIIVTKKLRMAQSIAVPIVPINRNEKKSNKNQSEKICMCCFFNSNKTRNKAFSK